MSMLNRTDASHSQSHLPAMPDTDPDPKLVFCPSDDAAGMPPPRYQTQPTMPWTLIHNKPPTESQPQNSPTNPFQPMPQASHNLFRTPAMGTNAMPIGRARETSTDQFADWD